MKSKKEQVTTRTVHSTYTASFKEQALERADKDDIPKVTQELGLTEETLYVERYFVGTLGNPL
ncbi:MAG: hypothetical protein EXR90_05925 [Methyloglobulus sp.]|nr:hypothetical protein [Methyloglobulus sp.]